jgi:hypothetical protein
MATPAASTDDQATALQLSALKRARCSSIFEDKGLSGASVKRPALSRCLKTLRAGDALIVWKLDRLGRSLRDLITMLDDLRARGVKFHSLTEAIDTATPTGRAMCQMIGVLAELERSLISVSFKGASRHSCGRFDFYANSRSRRCYYWRCWFGASGAAARFCSSGRIGECAGAGGEQYGGACSGE